MSKRNDVLALLHVAGQSGETCDITADLLAELCKAWLALDAAPEVWAGCRGGQWFAGADWRDAAHVKFHLSGFGTEDEQGRITTTRVRLVATSGGDKP